MKRLEFLFTFFGEGIRKERILTTNYTNSHENKSPDSASSASCQMLDKFFVVSNSDVYVCGYVFDKLGNRLSSVFNSRKGHAKRGKHRVYPAEAGTQSYKYNAMNQICSASSMSFSSSMSFFEYDYDPLGQRIKSGEIATNGTKITKFLMSGMVEQARFDTGYWILDTGYLILDTESSFTSGRGQG